MSSIVSASSRTKNSMVLKSTNLWLQRSRRRPGVATKMSTPRRRALTCGFWDTPP